MPEDDSGREIGRLGGVVESIVDQIERVETKLDKHIEEEDTRLQHIAEQLSLARFVWLTLKAVVLTIAFLFAFKFGDISTLWKALK